MEQIDHICLSSGGDSVIILDQTQLPNQSVYLELRREEELIEAIKSLRVRGAPAIGIFAGFAICVLCRRWADLERASFLEKLHAASRRFAAARPTAVNLRWALERIEAAALRAHGDCGGDILPALFREAQSILDEDIAMCRAISENGLSLLKDGDGILTHCNAGPMATSRYGTALGPLILGTERGMHLRVFADETRPLLQGARLTAYELEKNGVDVTLICDNMASAVMKNGWVQYCFVGCDRVAANGDTANKIGTSGVAILARHYGIPFYVLGPSSTIDLSCKSGAEIEIERRDGEEIRSLWYKEPMAPSGVKCYNPAFDVTEHQLISGIITEKGICRPPYEKSLAAIFKED